MEGLISPKKGELKKADFKGVGYHLTLRQRNILRCRGGYVGVPRYMSANIPKLESPLTHTIILPGEEKMI